MIRIILLTLAAILAPAFALEGRYSILTSTDTGLAVGMNLYVPPGYDNPLNAGKRYPLMVFLGGAGERGDQTDAEVILAKSTVWGPSKEIRYSDRDFPFIVVTPISTEWYNSLPNEYDAMITWLEANTRTDIDRVYFAGACAGASGVMEFAQVHPQRLAAIIPCLTQTPTVRNPERLQEMPTWFFHGFADKDVSREQTITWADAITNSFGNSISCMDTYPYGTTPEGDQTYNVDNQTGSYRPGETWSWRQYTVPSDDSLLLFTMMSTDLHNVWHYAVTNNTVLHWMTKQVRQSPYGGSPAAVPGRIQAERYDLGGFRRAYYDTSVENTGGNAVRDSANPYDGSVDHEQVDLKSVGSATVLTDTAAGEWLEYTINASSGTYLLKLRLSAVDTGGSVRLLAGNGAVLAGPISVPATTGYYTLTIPNVTIAPGQQTLRLAIDAGGFDLDWFEFVVPPGPADIIVDNSQTDRVTTTGTWNTTSVAPGYYGSNYLSAATGTIASATFRPTLPHTGEYKVYVQHPSQPSYGTVQVTIDSGSGSPATVMVDQHTNGGEWRPLGVYAFEAGSSATVTIAVDNATGYVAADAVRFWEVDPDNNPPVVALTAPAGGDTVASGTEVEITATASDPDTHSSTPGVQKVEFHVDDGTGAVLVGSDTSASGDPEVYKATFTPTAPGDYTITATAYDFASGVTVSRARTITVNAPAAGVLAFSAMTYSGAESAGTVLVGVQRLGGDHGAISVSYATSAGSATSADFTAATGTLAWADGDTDTKFFSVAIIQDEEVEGDENLTLSLSDPTGSASVGDPATLTITDDDTAPDGVLQFSDATYAQIEANAGTSTATITVTRSGGLIGRVGVTWATEDGTASASSDYVASTGTLSFGPGETSQSFTITIIGDTRREPDETIRLVLSDATGGGALGTQATATLVIVGDDGAAPSGGSTGGDANQQTHTRSCGGGSAFALLALFFACAFTGRARRRS